MKNLDLTLFLFSICLAHISLAQDGESNHWDDLDSAPIDTITFEEPDQLIAIDTSLANLWQIGIPQKVILDSAFSPPNAMITDTLENYPVENHSFFDFYLNDSNLWNENIFVGFYHKIDTDTLRDGGYLEISFNDGEDFYNVLENPDDVYFLGYPSDESNELNLYGFSDTLYNGEPGFSGRSLDWTLTMFGWNTGYIKPPKPDNHLSQSVFSKDLLYQDAILRFNFISDSIDNQREGWMIDELFTFWVEIIGSTENSNAIGFQMFPNPVQEELTLVAEKHYGRLSVEVFDMTGKPIKSQIYHSTNEAKLSDIELNSGFYLVTVTGDDQYLGTARLVIRR
jgi:hypothetical protein